MTQRVLRTQHSLVSSGLPSTCVQLTHLHAFLSALDMTSGAQDISCTAKALRLSQRYDQRVSWWPEASFDGIKHSVV